MTGSKAQATQYTVTCSVRHSRSGLGYTLTLLLRAPNKGEAEDTACFVITNLVKLGGTEAGLIVSAQATEGCTL